MKTHLTDSDPLTQKVIELYNSGASAREVGSAVYLSRSAVLERLKKAGVPRRSQGKRRLSADDPRTVKAAELYRNGATLEEASEAVDLSREALRYRFEQAGIIRRPAGYKISGEIISAMCSDRLAGMRPRDIARRYGVSSSTVYHHTNGLKTRQGESYEQRA